MTVIAFPTVAPFGTDSDEPLKVLRADLSDRVARVNDARYRLHKAGARVIHQDLLADPRPRLTIERGTDGLRNAAVCVRQTGNVVRAVLDDVDVFWPEPAQ